jgi:hypothetical protein
LRYFVLIFFLIFGGCGYKSAKSYSQNVIKKRVYTQIELYLRDPQNLVLIKDAVNQAVVERFGSSLTSKEEADTFIKVRVKKITFTPLEYDRYGYVIYYRTNVFLEFMVDGKKIVTSGFYDFPIEPNSVITDSLRYIAIKEGAKKAIDRFIAQVSILGLK